jgi:hypothetical protein
MPRPLSVTLSRKEGIHPATVRIHFDVGLVEIEEWDSGCEDVADDKLLAGSTNRFFFVERGSSR